MLSHTLKSLLLSTLTTVAMGQSVLLIPNATDDIIGSFSPVDGSLLDRNFIDGGHVLQTPINAIDSGRGTTCVSDFSNGAVYEYALDGSGLVGTIVDSSTGTTGIRGIAIHAEMLYVPVAELNSGGAGGGCSALLPGRRQSNPMGRS